MSKSSIFLSLYVSNCARCPDDCFICIHLTWNSLFLPILKQAETKRIHIPITKDIVLWACSLSHNNFDIGWSSWCLGIRLKDLETLDLGTLDIRYQKFDAWCLPVSHYLSFFYQAKYKGAVLSFGSGFKVQGSGLRWRLRRLFLEDGILVSQPSPLGEGAPQGRIGWLWHERQLG